MDEVTLSRVAVNSADLMEGMKIKGVLGRFFLQSHGVDLSNELAVINQVELSDTHMQLLMNDTTTTPKDTTGFCSDQLESSSSSVEIEKCIVRHATSC